MKMAANDRLRLGFKYLNRFMLLVWRLGLGSWLNAWPQVGGRIMVITHLGRKSGQWRHTPVNYVLIGDDVYCAAGFGRVSDWYRNILAHPNVEIWLPDGWWAAVAEDISADKDRLAWLRKVLIASGFATYLAGINPHAMSDDALAEVTADYRLIRIRRLEARTGANGPGDLAWIWPLATLILLCHGRVHRRVSGRRTAKAVSLDEE
jgi:deazaflavin-dependent oxidoreductase (nitroreductase family)